MDVGVNRIRGSVERSERIRERLLDHLMTLGGRVSAARMADAKEDFARCALRIATERGMRMWKLDNYTGHEGPLKAPLSSIAVLLGEKENVTPGVNGQSAMKRTGVNAGWVLDIWEATLDHYHREPLYSGRVVPAPDPVATEADVRAMNDRGPVVVQINPTASISARLLDAYLNRDDEAMMRIAIEVEQMEVRT